MRKLYFILFAVVGCSSPTPPQTAVVVPDDTKVEIQAGQPKDEPRVQAPGGLKPLAIDVAKQVEVKPEPFRFPTDAAGKKVEQTLTPKPPAAAPSRVIAPKPRVTELERGDLPLTKPAVTAAPLPLSNRKPSVPSPPNEGVPTGVGMGTELNLTDRKLPEAPTVSAPPRPQPTAADVPRLAYQLPDRASVEDPTAEISTLRIVNTLMLAPTMAVPFVRLILPDPFEFAEHVKPPAAPEFATAPVFVPPARP